MKLPVLERFQKQNYPGSPDWFTRFLGDINQFTETVWNTLNKNLTLSDNLDSQFYTFTLKAGAAAANNTQNFLSTVKHTPMAVLVGQVTDQTAYATPPTTAVGCIWTFSNPNVQVSAISGLTNGHTYQITLIVL